jgi:5-methylcytosine-specific restriction endonuclease McrA
MGWCRVCRTKAEKNRRHKKGTKPRKFSKIENNKKLCLHCNVFLDFSNFSPVKKGLGGLASYCRQCITKRPKNREIIRKNTNIYRVRHRERYLAQHRIHQFNRKHNIKVTVDGSVTDNFIQELLSRKICYYCNKEIDKKYRTIEHKEPLSRGGVHSAKNLEMVCFLCNCSKGSKTEREFKELLK